MKKFIRLLNFEMNRFMTFLIPTVIGIIVLQLIATIQAVTQYNTQVAEVLATTPGNLDNIISTMGKFSFTNITNTGAFNISLFAIIALFIFYSFFVWYRDWLGKNTFAYRLLMLPMNRISIFLAKALIFLIAGIFFYGLQHLLFYLWGFVAEMMIDNHFLLNLNIHNAFDYYLSFTSILFPDTVTEFFATYGFAFGALLALYTGIIMERSYRWKGLIAGIAYFILFFVIYGVLDNLTYMSSIDFTVTPSQSFIIQGAFIVVSLFVSTAISGRLLRDRITI